MKLIRLTNKFYTILILSCFIFTFSGCGGSDDDDNSCQVFLECQEGTVWENIGWLGTYLKFQNNTSNPWIVYDTYDGGCYFSTQSSSVEQITLIEHSENILKYKTGYVGGINHGIYTYTYSNGKITYRAEYYTNDVLDDITIITFNRSAVNLSSLEICN